MDLALAGTLAVLALVDSTSFGTLLIPIWLMLTPGRSVGRRVLVFLGTVGVFYFFVGLALLAGVTALLTGAEGALQSPTAYRIQLVIGVGLLLWSFRLGRSSGSSGGRLARWRQRLADGEGSRSILPLMGLALTAALLEVATMLPYLGATALIGRSDLPVVAQAGVLAAYCVVMLLPALVLLTLRVAARRLIEPTLERVGAWLERSSGEATAWVVGILGFLLARDAAGALNLLG